MSHNKTENTITSNNIYSYISNLKTVHPTQLAFKMNYLIPIRTNNETYVFDKFTHGIYSDYKRNAKTFIRVIGNAKNYQFDHGNHMQQHQYIVSDLLLVHYHARSNEQLRKKNENNVLGLGHKMDLSYLEKLNKGVAGRHHVDLAIRCLKTPNLNLEPNVHSGVHNGNAISLQPFNAFNSKINYVQKD